MRMFKGLAMILLFLSVVAYMLYFWVYAPNFTAMLIGLVVLLIALVAVLIYRKIVKQHY